MQPDGAIGPFDDDSHSPGYLDAHATYRPGVRRAYDITVHGYLIGFVAQLLLAGWSLFNEPPRWPWHRALGHTLEIVALAMVFLAFGGRMSRSAYLLTIALLILTIVQGALAGIGGWVGSVHPLTAFVIGIIVYRLSQRR